MELIADILLISGACGAAFYCFVLARRLARFNNLEQGMGGAVAVLSAQVDEMTRALSKAQGSAHGSAESLERLTERAEDVAKRLELLVASMHDLPIAGEAPPPQPRHGTVPPQAVRTARAGSEAPEHDREQETNGDGLFRSRRSWREAAE